MNWYYVNSTGQQAGPVDDAAMDALASSGAIHSETLVWAEGMPNWQPHRQARPNAVNVGPAPVGAGAQAPVASATGVEEAVCAECGGVFPINETIRIGSSRVCAKCKPVFVQKMREGMNVVGGAASGNYRYAGFWIRVVAKILDGFILGIVIMIPAIVIMMLMVGGTAAAGRNGGAAAAGIMMFLQLGINLIAICGQIVYSGIFLGKYGATPGKMACGLKVIKADGSRLSYGLGFGRALSEILSGMICYIGYIMVGFDDEKRGLHDRICNTRVIYK
jgi:uncharacterized RDD family membrane protein YckC